jgi:hypothetical protein
MKILLVPKEGVRLYHELLASETSRDALRFYRPVDTPCGIEITAASLGSALALIADIRWYVKRYMRGVLFEVSPGIYCSHRLAWEIFYEREIKLPESWDYRLIYRMKEGKVIREEQVVQGGERPLSGTSDSPEIEVWCTEDEYHGGSSTVEGEEIEPESSDENQESP